jgi:hypothetical protein
MAGEVTGPTRVRWPVRSPAPQFGNVVEMGLLLQTIRCE